MNNIEQDIVLIRKYHNGELSPAEKNKLEARALDDPFLQDALDGYEGTSVNEDELTKLYQKVEKRTAPQKVLIPVWRARHWGIAASLLLFIALGSLYFNQTPKNKAIALRDLQPKKDIQKQKNPKIESLEDDYPEEIAGFSKIEKSAPTPSIKTKLDNAQSYTPEPEIIVEPLGAVPQQKTEPTELAEIEVIGYGTQKKSDLTGSVSSVSSKSLTAARMDNANKFSPSIKIKGKIIDEKDSIALPGVSIKNLNTGEVKQTNAKGEFIMDTSPNENLSINYLGYDPIQKTIRQPTDSLLIVLKPSKSALSEMVVVGYGSRKAEPVRGGVAPTVGWKRFKKYADDQAQATNLGRGKVQIQFVIGPTGELSDFKIIDTFSAKAGVAAINIIKNYNSGWVVSTEKIPFKANMTIQFK